MTGRIGRLLRALALTATLSFVTGGAATAAASTPSPSVESSSEQSSEAKPVEAKPPDTTPPEAKPSAEESGSIGSALLRWALERLASALGGELTLEGIHGSVFDGLRASKLRWHSGSTTVQVDGARIDWVLRALFRRELNLRELHADRIVVTLAASEESAPAGPPQLPDSLALPLLIGLDAVSVGELRVEGPGLQVPVIRDLKAELSVGGEQVDLRALSASVDDWGSLQGHARIASARPYETSLAVRIEPVIAEYPKLTPLLVDAQGPIERLTLTLRMLAPMDELLVDGTPPPLAAQDATSIADARSWLTARTTLFPLSRVIVRSVDVEADAFDPARIGLPGPRAVLSGQIEAQADAAAVSQAESAGEPVALQALPWQGSVRLNNSDPGPTDDGRLPLRALRSEFSWRDQRIELSALDVDEGLVTGQARVDLGKQIPVFGVEVPEVQAQLALKDLDLAIYLPQSLKTQISGALTLDGRRLVLDLSDASRKDLQAKGDLLLDGERLRIDTLDLQAPGGRLDAKGSVSTQAPWTASLAGSFRRLDPVRLARLVGVTLPAQLATMQGLGGKWSIDGELSPRLDLATVLDLNEGRYQGRPLRLDWRGKVSPERLRELRLAGRLGDIALNLQGDAGAPGDKLALDLRAPDLAALGVGAKGALRVNGQAAIAGLDAATLAASEVSLKVDGQRLAYGEQLIGRVQAQLGGKLGDHRLELSVAGPQLTAGLGASGALIVQALQRAVGAKGAAAAPAWGWTGRVERFASKAPLAVTLASPMPVRILPDDVSAGPGTLRADGGSLALDRLRLRGGRFEVAGTATNLPVSRWAAQFDLIPPDAAAVDDVRLDGSWALAGTGIDDLDGTTDLRMRTSQKVDADGSASLRFNRGAVAGKLDLRVPSVAFINRQIGPEWGLDGRLRVLADVGGRLREPQLSGRLEGQDLAFVQRSLGWRLDRGTLDARFEGDHLQVQTFQLRSGEAGSVSLSGALRLADRDGNFRLLAERLMVPIGPGQKIVVSGDTTIVGRGDAFTWRGKLGVDEGLVELAGGNAPSLPGDVVIVDRRAGSGDVVVSGDPRHERSTSATPAAAAKRAAKDDETPPLKLAADLEIDLGGRLRVRGSGVDARLGGSLKLSGSLPDAPHASGIVEVREGVFGAYGQTLRIERGRVLFNGPIDNPTLDIVAMRRGAVVEAGVAVTGSALSPRIQLVSEPEVPDSQKLSWLVLGVGMEDAGSGAQSAALAAAAASIFGEASLDGGIAQQLGLDVLTLRNASETGFGADFDTKFPTQTGIANASTIGAARDVVAIGKRLSSRMMVTYEQGLRGVWSLLRVQYDLTRRLGLRAQTGTDTGLDLIYSYPFD